MNDPSSIMESEVDQSNTREILTGIKEYNDAFCLRTDRIFLQWNFKIYSDQNIV